MSVNNDNIKIFSEKNWLLLCKRPYDFVYMNTLDNQYYSIKETKTLKDISSLVYSFSISTGMIFKYLLPFFDWDVSINFRFISLFLILLLVVILTQIQLKKGEQWIVGNPITISSDEEKEIIAEAKQIYKTNITLFSILVIAFIIFAILFILTFHIMIIIMTVALAYYIGLLIPIFKFYSRKKFLSKKN